MKEMIFKEEENDFEAEIPEQDVENSSNDECLEKLLQEHEKIKHKKSFNKDERRLKHEIKSILFEQGIQPSEMARFLDVKRCTISYWLNKHHPSRERLMKQPRHNYVTTERERQLIGRFMMKFLEEVDEEKRSSINYNLKGIRSKRREI